MADKKQTVTAKGSKAFFEEPLLLLSAFVRFSSAFASLGRMLSG
jgi:hypothetical protein